MSWKEDNRSRQKRNNTRLFKKNHSRNISRNNKDSSSSPGLEPPQHIRGLIDVADSSDDRFSYQPNWTPQLSDDEEVNEQMQAADFEQLQNNQMGYSAYTQLSSEKHWETETLQHENEKNFEKTSYFTLNLALINAGLETIPFYKRMDYPNSMFDKQEIRRMNLEAELAEVKFQAVLNNYEVPDKPDSGKSKRSNSAKSNKTVKSVNSEGKLNNALPATDKNYDLDELLNMTESDVSKLKITEKVGETELKSIPEIDEKKNDVASEVPKEGNNTEDIQQWLDQVLE